MALLKLWNIYLCLITSTVAAGNTLDGNTKDIIDATAGRTFIIRTWYLNDAILLITVNKGNITRLNAHVNGYADNIARDQNDRLELKYNQSIQREAFLMFDNISKENEGLYLMEESFYTAGTDPYDRQDGIWSFQLNVLEEHEEMRRCVGEIITMEFRMLSEQSNLYLYNQTVALLNGSDCIVFTDSPFYGRLRCTSDVFNVTHKIIIHNVTQMDSGLYKIATDDSESGRWFLNITDKPTSAFIEDNVTICWYYNQQGMNRTLRIIHPNNGVMMMLQPSNNSTIKSNFQHRMLYSGDMLRCYMSLTLLNLSKSDTGVYTIETLHGNSIPGRKQLIVEDITTTSITSTVTFDTSSTEIPDYSPTNIPYGQQSTVSAGKEVSTYKRYRQNTESITAPDVHIFYTRKPEPSDEVEDSEIQRLKAEVERIEEESRKLRTAREKEEWKRKLQETMIENEKLKATVTTSADRANGVLINKDTNELHHSQSSTMSLLITEQPSVPDDPSSSLNVPVIVLPVIIGTASVVIVLIACLIRIRRMDTNNLEPERHHTNTSKGEWDDGSFNTSIQHGSECAMTRACD